MAKKRTGQVIFSEIEQGQGLRQALNLGRSDVLDTVRDSNLKGRGGAGFPTGVKWNLAATTQSDKKYIICNADEGEPGTFKDRILLSEYAPLVIEGMIVAAFAVGADEGIIYLRGEYASLVPCLEGVLGKMREQNLLGSNILGKDGFNFDINIKLGVGAYVCGEESSLIESLEGSRGEPRNKPPFPTNTGYHGRPTVVNNVETFATVVHIVNKGAEWFKKIGTSKSAGTKLISVSGDCKKPGVYEVPFGTTIKKILKMVQAENVKAVQVGGASGVCIDSKQFNRKIAYEDLSTGGSVIVLNKKRSLLEAVDNFLNFFAEESCGQCTPCREGLPVLIEAVDKIQKKQLNRRQLKDVLSLVETMQLASKCGLGQSAANALTSVLDNFKDEYKIVNK
jgi:[NiFe] hydrogenase diaphorase moiety large subunit